jgi:predicted  nucleic acid-binding Zn-ribbon protein
MQSQEQRIAELENELRQRDHYIVQLVGELDAARELIERMEKNVEDCISSIKRWSALTGRGP